MVQVADGSGGDRLGGLSLARQAARKSWRAWLEENTTGGAAKVHQLIQEPSNVDEEKKLRETCVAICWANTQGPVLTWPEDDGQLFHQPLTDAMRRFARSLGWSTTQCHQER